MLWTAKTRSVAGALSRHDNKESLILEAAFRKLVESYSGNIDRREYGMGENLEGVGSTFLSIAEQEKNISAFIAFHDLLKNYCSNKNCKLRVYCAREESPRRLGNCHYSSRDARFRSSDYCYVHGPNVWNYWENLNEDRMFYDSDFPAGARINEDECNRICRSEKCNRNGA